MIILKDITTSWFLFIFLVKYIFKIAKTLIKIILVIWKRETQYIWSIIIGNLEYLKYYYYLIS